MNQKERVAMTNNYKNLATSEGSINNSMLDKEKLEWADSERKKDPGKTNAESFGVDRQLLEETISRAEKHVDRTILAAQIKKQGAELAVTGAKEAGKNALRQALGVAIHTFVNGAFVELRPLFSDPKKEDLIDELVCALKRVALRVRDKLKHILDAGVSGLIQGFVSNLITFIINNVVTTAAKVVTMIREGMKSLWAAMKMLVNPPEGMTAIEIAREVSKILAAVITTSLGMLFEEAIKGFIASVPIFLPLSDILAPAVTAILTGVATALVVYSLDRFFDWLSSTGTELLEAMEVNLNETSKNVTLMCQWLESQFALSQGYQNIKHGYLLIDAQLNTAKDSQTLMIESQLDQVESSKRFNAELDSRLKHLSQSEDEINDFLKSYDR